MVRFVGSDPIGMPLKRKQVPHACDRCRRRKKRCIHTESRVHETTPSSSTLTSPEHADNPVQPATLQGRSGNHSPASSESSQTRIPSPNYSSNRDADKTSSAPQNETKHANVHATPFYGDLNPEAILMEATSLCCRRDVSAPGGVGIWQAPMPNRPISHDSNISGLQSSSRKAVQDLLKSYLWKYCLSCRPPSPDYDVLRRIYFEKMNPIFPIFDEHPPSTPLDEVTEILVQQVVSLAAASDPEATQHLRVQVGGPLLTRQDFNARLSHSVLTTLDTGLVTDRVWLTRLSAALSLYTQPTSPEEADIPAQLNSRAVHQMHTLGLHMAVDDRHEKRDMIPTIFCCLWALDRITSAFYGRACLIHERDVGWNIEECIRRQAPPFRLLLMIVDILERVINLYRPGTRQEDKPAVIVIPTFEQMIIDAEALRLPSSCLEVFYHSVAILSTQSPADITSSALPSPAVNSRRSLSADRITSIIGEEFAGQLTYMPLIPYGVSLSLSVSYRKMRHSKVPMFRTRGKQMFKKNTLILKSMDDMFWKSKTMVAMAEQVLNEMDRAVASLAQENGLTDFPKRVEPAHHGERSEAQPEDRTLDYSMHNMMDGGNEWMLFDAVPDLDVFGHFDPRFDLGAVDAALDGSLEIGTSTNWFDWQQQWL
ncbi:hypothetical protein GGS20DRAFT_20578 [Poronia punctata]|nr:hypothetical protein GGS20DRAFT_20578 [Poronia punctata]